MAVILFYSLYEGLGMCILTIIPLIPQKVWLSL